MAIQWFPGHMTKALRMIEENVRLVDMVCYVLDSRAPYSCINPSLNNLMTNKPIMYVFNKYDLADGNKISLWKNLFASQNNYSVATNATDSASAKTIIKALGDVANERVEKYAAKGINRPTRVMIIGVPNSGKSTLINTLCGRKAAITGDKPGVTKGKQWIRLPNGLELLDTPGTLWPSFESQRIARHLVYIGSIKDDVVDLIEITLKFIEEIVSLYPNALTIRYKVEVASRTPQEILDAICIKRGFVLRGADIDYERGAKAIIDDFRKGKLGRITFDVPNDKEQ